MATDNEFSKPPAKELTDKPVPSEVTKAKTAKVKAKAAALQEKPAVLIIIGDNDIHFGDDQSVPAFMSALKDLGYKVRIEESKETSYSTWNEFNIIVWSCRDDYSTVNIKSMEMLVEQVAKGGRLLLKSGNMAAWNKEFAEATTMKRRFREKVLHATTDWAYHDVGELILKTEHPVATTPNKLPEAIGFTPTEPGDFTGDANAVRILPGAKGIYVWSHVAYETNGGLKYRRKKKCQK